MKKIIFLADMEAFYASVEVAKNPSLTGKPVGVTLTVNGEVCTYTGLIDKGKKAYIDTDRMTVQLDGVNSLLFHDGGFPVLLSGENTVVYTSPNGSRANIKITDTERWL